MQNQKWDVPEAIACMKMLAPYKVRRPPTCRRGVRCLSAHGHADNQSPLSLRCAAEVGRFSETDATLAQTLGQLRTFLFSSFVLTGIRGPTRIFWAARTFVIFSRVWRPYGGAKDL